MSQVLEAPEQTESFAKIIEQIIVDGKILAELPSDLYIPPDALRVLLDSFAGPLDLLLYLIRKHNMDILNIPIVEITRQYMHYIDVMHKIQLELAADYLVMAALLAEIKSKMLLPRSEEVAEEELDPRAELMRRLQIYECFKLAAENLEHLPRMERDTYEIKLSLEHTVSEKIPDIDLTELTQAFMEIVKRSNLTVSHMIKREVLSVRERMSMILNMVDETNFVDIETFFKEGEGVMGVVVTFLAVLELVKEALLELVQVEAFGIIRVKAVGACQH